MKKPSNIHKRGFASMSAERRREITSMGGRAVPHEKRSFSRDRDLASVAGKQGGRSSGGNFANDASRASEAGRKGGLASGGNFRKDPARASICGRKGGSARS